MKFYPFCACGTTVLALTACVASACGGEGSSVPPASPVNQPPPHGGDAPHVDGIGLGNVPTPFDAGADAHRSSVDAAALRGKQTNGRLAPEKVQQIVRADFREMQKCYERGLRASPDLAGRVSIKFVIDIEGHVTSAVDEGSELADREVIQCVADNFKKLRFPKPEGGIVTVVYPIIFKPGD